MKYLSGYSARDCQNAFSFRGFPPDQGLCPWTLLDAKPLDQGRIHKFALGGPSPPLSSFFPFSLLLFPSLPFSSPSLTLTLRSRYPLNQLGGLGECCKLPQRGLGRAVRKPLAAIIRPPGTVVPGGLMFCCVFLGHPER